MLAADWKDENGGWEKKPFHIDHRKELQLKSVFDVQYVWQIDLYTKLSSSFYTSL